MTRPPKYLWILPPVAALAGYLLAPAKTAPSIPASDVTPNVAASAPGSASAIQARASSPAGGADWPRDFASIVRHQSRATRIAASADYFATLGPAEFQGALQALLRMPRDQRDGMLVSLLFQAWMRRDPAGAIAGVESVSDSSLRDGVRIIVARAWARRDLTGAKAWAAKNLSRVGLMSFNRYVETLEGRGSGASASAGGVPSFEDILKDTDLQSRKRNLTTFFRTKAQVDPAAAARLLAAVPEDQRNSSAFAIAVVWKERDPLAAARWFSSPEAVKLKLGDSIITDFTDALAKKDPAGGLELVHQIDLDQPWHRHFASTFLHKIYDRDPGGVRALLEDPKFDRADFPERYGLLALQDPEAAFQKALDRFREDPGDESQQVWRMRGMKSVLTALAPTKPEAAARLILNAPPETYSDLFSAVGEEWCKRNATAATAWAQSLPAGQARDRAMREFTFLWAKSDSNASAAWLDKLPAGSSRNEAILGFSVATMDTDPDGALAWARTVTEGDKRAYVLGRAWAIWNRKNPTAASDWLERSGSLKPEERAMILEHEF